MTLRGPGDAMLCLNMKLSARLKGDKARGERGGIGGGLGGALGGVPREAGFLALAAPLAGHSPMLPPGQPRDRSKSLCVDRVMAALVRPGYDPATLAARDLNLHNIQRRRA
ncbi:hypothetical protein FOCC_FOCC004145, partial [Frankliniella occidentalis]